MLISYSIRKFLKLEAIVEPQTAGRHSSTMTLPARDLDTAASIDEAIASLEQVIQDAQAKILNLRARRNERVPSIARLPAEILAKIFILFEHEYRQDKSLAAQTGFFGWLVITHVCRHWRGVARALPHLWSHIPMSHNDEPIKMFLELSKGVPLSITPGTQVFENELQPEIFSLLIPEASRIRSLSLCLPTTLPLDLTSKVWDAPLLESIDLYHGHQSMPDDRAIAFIQDVALPTLRSLSLATFSYTAAHDIPRSTLTTLVIRHPVAALRVAEWVDVLDALPLLEHLVLVHAMKANTNDEPVSRPVARSVTMARLVHVELRDRVCWTIWPCLHAAGSP